MQLISSDVPLQIMCNYPNTTQRFLLDLLSCGSTSNDRALVKAAEQPMKSIRPLCRFTPESDQPWINGPAAQQVRHSLLAAVIAGFSSSRAMDVFCFDRVSLVVKVHRIPDLYSPSPTLTTFKTHTKLNELQAIMGVRLVPLSIKAVAPRVINCSSGGTLGWYLEPYTNTLHKCKVFHGIFATLTP